MRRRRPASSGSVLGSSVGDYIPEPGYDNPEGASIVDPDGAGPPISWLRVPEGKTAKNRVHIDVRVAGKAPTDAADRDRLIRAKVTELIGLGATVVHEAHDQDLLDGVVMEDPEGSEFCVA